MKQNNTIQDAYGLSPLQEGIYFHSIADAGSQAYFVQSSFRWTGEMKIGQVEPALQQLFARHDILRTCFVLKDLRKVVQVVLNERQPDFKYEDLRGVADKEDHLQRRRIADRSTPFDLGRDVLMRVQLFRLADNEYEFLWSHHHILMDGWCTGILLQEFAQLYAGLANGRPVQLPRSVPYRAFIQWLEGCDRQQAADHWQKVLAHTTRPTGLPRNKTAQPGSPYQNREVALQLDATLTARIQARAAATQVTLNTFLQGVWSVLLSKYNSCDQVVFGTVAAVRPAAIPGVESMVGLLINTLPVSVCIDHRQPFHQLLQQMQGDALAAAPFHYFPLADIQAQSTLKQQLIDHVFVLGNFSGQSNMRQSNISQSDNDTSAGSPAVRFASTHSFAQVNYDFSVNSYCDRELNVRFNYNGQVYDERYIHALSRQFAALLTQVVDATPDLLTGDLRLLSDLQQQTLLQLGRGPQSQYPANTLDALFRRQVRLRGEHPALATAQGPLSYLTLHQQASQLCTRLRQHGITPGTAVGVCCGRSTHGMILSMIALAYCSAIYVPLDPDHPIQRLQYILDDSSIQLILTSEPFLPLCQSLSKKLLRVDDNHYPDGPHSEPEPAQPHHIAYHIYTSGSTGNPKGVPIRHDSIADRVCYHIEYLRLRTDDAVLQFAAVAFDASIMEVWMALLAGARLVLLDDHAKQQLPVFTQHILDNAVSTLILPPAYLRLLNRHPLPSVTRIISTGEAANVDDMRWYAAQGKLVYNGYGPTEVCVGATFYQMPPEHLPESGQHNPIPIGTPFSNTLVCLLDHHQQLLPEGAPGEICIGGIGLSPGYLNAPELAASRFLTPRFDTSAGRLYRTGDRGRWNSNGQLEFLGRIDSQVQIRGIRVEPAEIEQTLLAFPGITQAAVIYFADPPQTLVAFLATDNPPDTENLRRHLAGKLPQYMIPAQFVLLEQLPLTSNGKIDRIILQRPAQADLPSGRPPQTDTEIKLAAIWEELLNQQSIGVDANFFLLGGHSLKATQLVSYLLKEFNVKIDIGVLFDKPVLADLATVIDRSRREEFMPIGAQAPADYHTVSPSQKRIWILSQFKEAENAYVIPLSLWIEGKLNKKVWRRSIVQLLERHAVLRATFHIRNGEVLQRFHALDDFPDCYEETEVAESDIEEWIRKRSAAPFDLQNGPLLSMTLVSVDETKFFFYCALHHLITDGWSIQLLIKELSTLYSANLQHLSSGLPEITINYADYCHWLQLELKKPVLQDARKYWQTRFAHGVPITELPTDRPRPTFQDHHGAQKEFHFAADVLAQLKTVAQQHGSSVFIVVTALLKTLLHKLTGQQEIVAGIIVSGREHADLDLMQGCFVNTVLLKTDIKAEDTFGFLLEKVKNRLLEAYKFQRYPFDLLVDELAVDREPSRAALFDVMISYQTMDQAPELRMKGLKVKGHNSPGNTISTKVDLEFEFYEHQQQINAHVNYNTSLYDESTITQWLSLLAQITEDVLKETTVSVAHSGQPRGEQLQKLLDWSKGSDNDFPSGHYYPLFCQTAERYALRPALYFNGGAWSYAQLRDWSGSMAGYLSDKYALREGQIVGCLMERGPEMIGTVLAIWQCGAVYLPLDPNLPDQRILFMLADSCAELLITDKPNHFPTSNLAVFQWQSGFDQPSSVQSTSRKLSPDQLSYIIYTSGSTGTPKGVMIEHRGMVNHLYCKIDHLRLNKHSKVAQIASQSFDISIWQMFAPLLCGASVRIYSRAEVLSVGNFLQSITAEEISILQVVPGYLTEMLDQLEAGLGPQLLPHLQFLLATGEELKMALLRRWFALVPHVPLVNAYGPTEASDDITHLRFDHPPAGTRVPIGYPLPHLNVYVVDACGNLCPQGLIGEIQVSGIGVGKGYIGDTTKTLQAFGADPFRPGDLRLYHTGDLGRWNDRGQLEFFGRKDQQIKIRGHRVETGEIEEAILAFPGINSAAVRYFSNGDLLVAYFTSLEQPDTQTLRKHLESSIPLYMIPSQFVHLAAMPLTLNGKIDRNQLRKPVDTPRFRSMVPPDTDLQRQIADLWCEILHLPEVGIEDNFFEIGGHSLRAITLTGRLEKALGVHVELKDVFLHPTISLFSRLIESMQWLGKRQPLDAVEGDFASIVI